MKIVILHDAITASSSVDEADVLTQAETVAAALHELGHTTSRVAFSLNMEAVRSALESRAPDLVFNLVESVGGHGRLIHLAPALLDAMGLAFAGCPTDAIYATSNKLMAKRMMDSAHLATPKWLSDRDHTSFPHHGKYILKSVWEHASRGIDDDSIVDVGDTQDLIELLTKHKDRLAGEGFAERYIDGREFNLAFIADGEGGVRALPPAEIEFVGYEPGKPRIVGYSAKWAEGSFEYENTPRRYDFGTGDSLLVNEMVEMGLACWRLFGLRGWARVDFRVDENAKPWVLEVNSNPCLSPDAGFAAAVAQAGMTLTDAVRMILADL